MPSSRDAGVSPETARRVLASWRARAAGASVAVGAQVFSVGTGVLMPVSLNAAWLAALPAVPAAALLALCARRALDAQRRRGGVLRPLSRALRGLLALTLLSCGIAQSAALAALAQQTLLLQARAAFALLCALPAAALCAQGQGLGAGRLAFALRWMLPLALFGLTAATIAWEDSAGLFPLLGMGAGPLARAMLCAPGGAVPALLLLLPPPELTDAQLDACPLPGGWFFAWRAALGAAVGVALLFAAALYSSYETLAELTLWGERMRLLSTSRPREGLPQTALILTQVTVLLLGAAVMLGGAVQAARGALAGERLGGGRAGRIAAAGCALLAALAAWALVGQGFDGARLAMPLLALPALVLALCAGRL